MRSTITANRDLSISLMSPWCALLPSSALAEVPSTNFETAPACVRYLGG